MPQTLIYSHQWQRCSSSVKRRASNRKVTLAPGSILAGFQVSVVVSLRKNFSSQGDLQLNKYLQIKPKMVVMPQNEVTNWLWPSIHIEMSNG